MVSTCAAQPARRDMRGLTMREDARCCLQREFIWDGINVLPGNVGVFSEGATASLGDGEPA